MADDCPIINNMNTKNGNFICGVVEGFYGRPWTSEQRKDLFQKLKKWGMNSYVYAPKDDSKHRANWRDLYTVEEAEHLTSLITASNENGVTFYYALSPGLDITYSNSKEVLTLKRKLEQVSQFGCVAFALLFDDIDPEMSEADKEVFQSFAHAQVSVTNDVYHHLNQPKFLLCPTQYCAARAVPNVQNSEYLLTLGSKLAPDIDIMWTGSKVISRVLTVDSIEEVTEVLKRPPVIWDNLHANDYDQKRVFLGPYQGRSPDLIPRLRGVLTNPNCEFWANFIAIHTLAQWSRCNSEAERDRNESVCSDIKLETEADDGTEIPTRLPVNMYHARRALKNAIADWLPEFHRNRQASGFITKPQVITTLPVTPAVLAVVPTPSVVNTCIALTTTSTVSSVSTSTPQLSALADVCTTVNGSTGPIVMNSLLSETKVCTEPMDCNATPPPEVIKSEPPSQAESSVIDKPELVEEDVNSLDDNGAKMVIDSNSPESSISDMNDWNGQQLNTEDVTLLCDLFYLPFEHGTQGIQLLQEFYWLYTNAHLASASPSKPEGEEWHERAKKLDEMSKNVNKLFQKLNNISNKELMYELYPYIWEMRAVISTLNSYIKWLGTGKAGQSSSENPAVGNYTWFSKGWKESFMSGEQEPWVFRGGLTADLQRLIPIDGGSDLFVYKVPQTVSSTMYTIRGYQPSDNEQIVSISQELASQSAEQPNSSESAALDRLSLSRLTECLIQISTDICFIVEEECEDTEEKAVAGYALAFINAKDISSRTTSQDPLLEIIANASKPQNPSVMCCGLRNTVTDQSVSKRLILCLLAALRANGSCGVFTLVDRKNDELVESYTKLGFLELSQDEDNQSSCLGRVF
ncbi:protein O-GlcNAcase [Halyomorpha halys]|uniref:protein O-GlcNAcase n=1 Tax=Halyomorpha halys TaxID=286706 RepID=UPI0006D4CD44|nr:protein O-GlcNAcase [Halyomorpha halys]